MHTAGGASACAFSFGMDPTGTTTTTDERKAARAARDDQIRGLYAAGLRDPKQRVTMLDLAARFGLSETYVCQIIRRRPSSRPVRARSEHELEAARESAVLTAIEAALRDVAVRFGMRPARVMGLAARAVKRRWRADEARADALRLYDEGRSFEEIADVLGLGMPTARKIVRAEATRLGRVLEPRMRRRREERLNDAPLKPRSRG